MPGQAILVIDDSLSVQGIAQNALESAGYHVTTASNGAAALTYPSIDDIDLIVMGSDLAGLSGQESIRLLKQNAETHPIPTLLLVPEEQIPDRENLNLAGAAGFLLKPFDGNALVRKVEQLLDQRDLDELARQYLSDSADRLMKKLADEQIQSSVERKTQLIIERCIQNITSAIDQKARGEVDQRLTGLIAEKEQELVKLTVREVAQSMVDKLAQRKVEEAMEAILREETEKAVKRAADQLLPNQIRDKAKNMLENILPREVERQLDRAAEKRAEEISEQIKTIVDAAANKSVPRAGRELLPPLVESQVAMALDQALARQVADLVHRELTQQMPRRLEPSVKEAASRIRRGVLWINGIVGALLLAAAAAMIWLTLPGAGK